MYVQVLHSKVEDILLEKESIDIIVSEWMGHYLLHESMLDSVLFARDRFLKKSGLLFPDKCQLFAAPCTLLREWNEQIGFWKENHYGFKFDAFHSLVENNIKPEICEV